MRGRSVAASPIAPLVAFSAATNLGIAGRTVRVEAGLPGEARLRAVLAGFGARIVDTVAAQVVFVADAGFADAGIAPADGGTVVVAAGASPGPAPLRPGVVVVGGAALDLDADARIDRARAHMPVSRALAAELGDITRGVRIGVSMVLEPKTAVLALLLQEAGAAVDVFAFAAETDDAVAAALAARGIAVHAAATATPAEELGHALALLDARPRILVDDGAHVIRLAHRERRGVVADLVGATEETTSGVTPLRAMAADGALRVPVIAANDAGSKTWIDNRHGTGETCVLAIVRALDDDLDGARVAVIGFGPVGEGCAERLRALGAQVTVVDRDPRRALAARYAGYAVASTPQAVACADLIVSATGVRGTVDTDVLAACRDDAVIAVAGGAPEEVLPPAGTRVERIGPHLERLHLPPTSPAPPPADGGALPAPAGGGALPAPAGGGALPAPAGGGALPAPAVGGALPAPGVGGALPAPAVGGVPPPPADRGALPAPAVGGVPPPPADRGASAASLEITPGPHLPPHTVRLLAGGDCVNIVVGEGNPIDVMDLSFAVQLAAIRRLLAGPALPPGVHPLGDDLDAHVAAVAIGAPVPSGRLAPAASPEARWVRTRFDLPGS